MEPNNGNLYYYLKDALGNIIGLAAFLDDYYYEVKVEYKYDAWGNLVETTGPLSSTVGAQNPFLYKGYYFDRETGYYYLQSRYYSPEWCRFINADDPSVLNITQGDVMGVNLFAYCHNNPVNDSDPFGNLSAKQVANMFSVSAIFTMFMAMMYANYAYGLAAVGVHVLKIATPISFKALWWNPKAAVALVAAAVVVVVVAVGIYFAKKAKESAKARATNCPSWLAGAMNGKPPRWGEKSQDYARRLLDDKYGKGRWKSGADSEYNKIVKYLQRNLGMK